MKNLNHEKLKALNKFVRVLKLLDKKPHTAVKKLKKKMG